MSKNLKQVAEDVRVLSRMFKGVTMLADTIDEIGSIEQLGKECQARTEKLKAETAQAQEQFLDISQQLNDSKAELAATKGSLEEVRESLDELRTAWSQMRQELASVGA